MRVTREPALALEVRDAAHAHGQLAPAGLDLDPAAHGLVLEAAREIDRDPAERQPALALAVDVGVRGLAEAQVGADVEVPVAEVRVDMCVVAVGRERNALVRAEVDATRDQLARLVVDDPRAHPGAPAVDDLDAQTRASDRACRSPRARPS